MSWLVGGSVRSGQVSCYHDNSCLGGQEAAALLTGSGIAVFRNLFKGFGGKSDVAWIRITLGKMFILSL